MTPRSGALAAARYRTATVDGLSIFYREAGDDLPEAEVHLLDAGHFALDEAAPEIAELIRSFFAVRKFGRTAITGVTGLVVDHVPDEGRHSVFRPAEDQGGFCVQTDMGQGADRTQPHAGSSLGAQPPEAP